MSQSHGSTHKLAPSGCGGDGAVSARHQSSIRTWSSYDERWASATQRPYLRPFGGTSIDTHGFDTDHDPEPLRLHLYLLRQLARRRHHERDWPFPLCKSEAVRLGRDGGARGMGRPAWTMGRGRESCM